MSTEASSPAESLAARKFDSGPFPGVFEDEQAALNSPLDMGRVKQKPGSGHDYLPEHDVIRTANRIFGFGRWGTEVVWHEPVGQHQVTNAKNEDGWYVGYRCCVRLTVAGCVPVSGVGYGDAFEKQWSAVVTAHELAAKEAESDAIKRAFKKFGDQFGLILYAKSDDRRRIAADVAEADRAANPPQVTAEQFFEGTTMREATPAEVDEVLGLADKAGIGDAARQAVTDHRDKNRGLGYECVVHDWLQRLSDRVLKEGVPETAAQADSAFTPPAGVQETTTAVETAFGEGAEAA